MGHPSRFLHLRSALVLAVLALGVFAAKTQATSKNDITYPITELGNCASEDACRAYCEETANRLGPCFGFAKQHNLITQEEIDRAKKFTLLAAEGIAPGQCTSGEECYEHCRDEHNLTDCLDFVERHDLIAPEKLADARRIANVLSRGEQLPGNCRSKTGCYAYCSAPEHFQQCFDFYDRTGLASAEALAEMREFADLMKLGETPGGCTSKDECESFCADITGHFDECIAFGVKAGYVTEEEAELAKKTGGVGPGGCKSKEECQAHCNDPANQQSCFSFAESTGVLPADLIEQYKQQYSQQYLQQPPQGQFPAGGFPAGGFQGGAPPEGFPPGGFQGGSSPEGFPGGFPQGGFPDGMPPEGFSGGPPSGGFPGPPGGGYAIPEGGLPGGLPPGGFQGGAVPPDVQQQYPQQYPDQSQQSPQQFQAPAPPPP